MQGKAISRRRYNIFREGKGRQTRSLSLIRTLRPGQVEDFWNYHFQFFLKKSRFGKGTEVGLTIGGMMRLLMGTSLIVFHPAGLMYLTLGFGGKASPKPKSPHVGTRPRSYVYNVDPQCCISLFWNSTHLLHLPSTVH